MMKVFGQFNDKAIYDGKAKTAISVRDGVLEYLGAEIGFTPPDKVFRVYRSPATIANAAALMPGIALTNDHVSLDTAPINPKGKVLTSKMIDLKLADVDGRLGILNTLQIEPDLQLHLDAGKRELSLGYTANLVNAVEGSNFDLEQIEIVPHHLAVVTAGRCGSACSFIDHKRFDKGNDEMKVKHKAFADADGNPSMTEIVAIVQALPDALKSIPADKLAEVMPVLTEIVKAAGITIPAAGESDEGLTDEEKAAAEAEKNKATTDTDEGEPMKKDPIAVTDSKAFKDALAAATSAKVARHVEVMDKARSFLPADYAFKDKSTEQVMRDAVAVEHGTQSFSDAELDIAFKMLKKTQSKHQTFGDGGNAGKFSKLADKEI
jgi:hypothetical protein